MRLETERLLLRSIEPGDLNEVVALHSDSEVTRFVRPLDRGEAKERLDRDEREWQERGHGLLAMIDPDSGAFLGRCGLKFWPQFGETEVGWVLRRSAWGQGYATEAGRACIEWGFAELDLDYLTAMVNANNLRSIRVAERLGFTPQRKDLLLGDPVVVYRLRSNRMKVRQANESDARRIAEIHVRSWQAAYRGILPDSLLDDLSVSEREQGWDALLSGEDDRWLTLVAEDDGDGPIGFCSVATPSRNERVSESTAEIGALYLDPDHWREGAGSGLLSAALDELREKDWRDVILWVLPENRAAIVFYQRFGFTIDSGVEKHEERSERPVIRLSYREPESRT